MKLALMMMWCDKDIPYINLHVPIYCKAFDGIFIVTERKISEDIHRTISEIAALRPMNAYPYEWHDNWSDALNYGIKQCEILGYDAVVRLDPDELIYSESVDTIRWYLESKASLLMLPRYEFFYDRLHVRTEYYPDHQARCWRLNQGIVYNGQRHEGFDLWQCGLTEDANALPHEKAMRLTSPHIYHYGWIGKDKIRDNQLKYTNYTKIDKGETPIDSLPDGIPLMTLANTKAELFYERQPLDPNVVGIFAPWSC